MAQSSPSTAPHRGLIRRFWPVIGLVLLAGAVYLAIGRSGISLEALVDHRLAIDRLVEDHRIVAVLAFLALYILVVVASVPGATVLTLTGGFLFGLVTGGLAAVVGATVGATLIFLVARSAFGEPLLRRAGPRAAKLAQGFRDDAFSYLLFLRLVPAFPFFLVNLVPAFAGVRLGPFVAATAIGIIPASFVYAFAGTGLDSIISAQAATFRSCRAAGRADCAMTFNPWDVLTSQMLLAMLALGLLALVPVAVKRLRARPRASS
ncbi:MAG: TVP38/TMEM64 family protein [Pseudolabrys sp.]|nr:TVP38/TMEM64 family protein [Pseudolabrys sp.]